MEEDMVTHILIPMATHLMDSDIMVTVSFQLEPYLKQIKSPPPPHHTKWVKPDLYLNEPSRFARSLLPRVICKQPLKMNTESQAYTTFEKSYLDFIKILSYFREFL